MKSVNRFEFDHNLTLNHQIKSKRADILTAKFDRKDNLAICYQSFIFHSNEHSPLIHFFGKTRTEFTMDCHCYPNNSESQIIIRGLSFSVFHNPFHPFNPLMRADNSELTPAWAA